LGKTIRFRNIKGDTHTALIEEKPEVKKAGGVFYTPQYIVDYIVQNTVGEKLKNLTPKEAANIKICDPACGSGSFLVGAYQYLLDYHLDYYTQAQNIKPALTNGKIFETAAKSYKLTIGEKQRILTNSIFGVDVDSQAVEVTKLSLYLKLLENEGKEAEGWLFKHSDRTLLPSLEENIRCGNSLIGTDFYEQMLFKLTDEEQIKVNCFDWQKGFANIFKAGGFDVVIGNPPYVRIHEIPRDQKDYYWTHYVSASSQFDLYQLFYEKALGLLKMDGDLGFITSNKFCITRYGKVLREYIFDNYDVTSIVDVSNLNVFKDASTYPYIFIIKKSTHPRNFVQISLADNVVDNNIEISLSKKVPQSKILVGYEKNLLLNFNKEKAKLLLKIESVSTIDSLSVYRGRGTSKDLTTKPTKKTVMSITNKQIDRFVLSDEVFYRNKALFANDFEPKLLMKKICYAIDVAIDEEGDINPINTVYVIKSKNESFSLKFLLGILCSKLMTFYARTKYLTTHMRGGYIELRAFEVETLPIPKLDMSIKSDKAKHDKLASLVDKMLILKKRDAAETKPEKKSLIAKQISAFDNAIDSAVYELYGLSEAEVWVVKDGIK
jgi:type I restriction-modification system DNA methylase subunit